MTKQSDAAYWSKITAVPRPFDIIDFPRKDPETGEQLAQVYIHVLRHGETAAANADAEKFAKKVLGDEFATTEKNVSYGDLYSNEQAVQLLFRACRRVDDPKLPFFPSQSEIRANLTNDEISVLMSAYIIISLEYGPIAANMTEEEIDEWLKKLQEAGKTAPLAVLSRGALIRLVSGLASRAQKSSTDTGSLGLPQESSTKSDESSDPSFDRERDNE